LSEIQKPRSSILWGLLNQRLRLGLSLKGWFALFIALAASAALFVLRVHSFLAVNHPIHADALVIEGWISDRAFEKVVSELGRGHYSHTYTTGGPVDWVSAPRFGGTYAGYCAERLERAGIPAESVTAVPSTDSDWQRTYRSAAALREFFGRQVCPPVSLNVITVGPHARRTRLLYQRALGNSIKVGIISLRRDDYDPDHWWRTSTGLREVIGETAAYAYCRLFPAAFAD
jgi:uncharacterized SAM-binding protein YcdF (DUF218 family)